MQRRETSRKNGTIYSWAASGRARCGSRGNATSCSWLRASTALPLGSQDGTLAPSSHASSYTCIDVGTLLSTS